LPVRAKVRKGIWIHFLFHCLQPCTFTLFSASFCLIAVNGPSVLWYL
jgi:hypothetical protein